MNNAIVGRNKEQQMLEQYVGSARAEFIAIYGRRRVGKTFLVRLYFGNRFAFDMTGIIEGGKSEQMAAFNDALIRYGHKGGKVRTWLDAFFALRDLLSAKPTDRACVVFIDELPCLDTPKSGFVHALGHFWNSWAAWQPHVKLIVCGSATSWMVRNVIDNHGGLHDRVTHELALKPFTLAECESYFRLSGFPWSRLGVLQCYMAVGGVPYYLSMFRADESPAQGIDRLFFADGGELRHEFRRLFSSLFRTPEPYLDIVRALATKPSGLTREELCRQLKVENNGRMGDMLTDLVYCDFVSSYQVKEKKLKTNSAIYKLVDFFTLFYHTFMRSSAVGMHYWLTVQGTPAFFTFMGLAYERVCLAHVAQIKKRLGIDRISTLSYAWRSKDPANPAQIDMIIERADKMINLCEIKYSETEYTLTHEEFMKIGRRVEAFRDSTSTRNGIVPTMITTFGLAKGMYADSIHTSITLDDLFMPL